MKKKPHPGSIDLIIQFLYFPGDEATSFTKEEMQQGKHTDYEKALHDEMIKVRPRCIDRI